METLVLEDPREQRRRRRLAVRASHDDGAFAADEKFLEQFGQRAVMHFLLEHGFRFRVPARNGVADDDEVRFVPQVFFRETRHHSDAALRQKRGHGWIDILVRTRDLKSPFLHRRGHRGHRRAADTDEMNGANIGKHASMMSKLPERGSRKSRTRATFLRRVLPACVARFEPGPAVPAQDRAMLPDRRPALRCWCQAQAPQRA